MLMLSSCGSDKVESWDYKIDFEEEQVVGIMKLEQAGDSKNVSLLSHNWGLVMLDNVIMTGETLTADFKIKEREIALKGSFEGDKFSGNLTENGEMVAFSATKEAAVKRIDNSDVQYLLTASSLPATEKNIDHKGIIELLGQDAYKRGSRIYNSNCINCHGTPEIEGSIPLSHKFWKNEFKAGSDPYSMYQTVSKGMGAMPPQMVMSPQEKYDVIHYIQQNYLKEKNKGEYVQPTAGYLSSLPEGNSKGPDPQPYQPWSDMDYGNFFINTYELADEETGIARYHSPRPTPYADEDYTKNNFAYKGIAVRLDEGAGGVSKGKSWMIFDHDVMRVAGGWTGEGFIDWNAILLNDRHETYPRTIGKLHFETPVGPGWANPANGTFKDPRFRARDGRQFGPLPKKWANYKGLYHTDDNIIISYAVGKSDILERLGAERFGDETVFTRTLNISASNSLLKMKVTAEANKVAISGNGGTLSNEDGFVMLNIKKGENANLKLFIAAPEVEGLDNFASSSPEPESLAQYTKGGKPHYPQELKVPMTTGSEDGLFAIDWLTPPFDNPWKSRMRMSGIDFMEDANVGVACTTDGDVWKITGLTSDTGELTWKRIGAGLFQPLGIKVIDEKIYIICRDQIVLLRDFNGDDETDFYESFNHDHQVTDHFHEFAMGLQADAEGNLYYAKSGRHARESLIPQHGTLLKVSADGSSTEILANGFRAANGVAINPDGSLIVTDQQGYWNPMNRINWIDKKGQFFGNMWGFDPPKDSSDNAMEPPMIWVDMEFDRSPSELLWVDSEKWGPLNGGLLSFSYGFGKIQLVLSETVNGQRQGGVIDIPGVNFLTGIMRGRFNPEDGHLYACGMSAWGTTQMQQGGGLYRVRYTGKPITMPIGLNAMNSGIKLSFASKLEAAKATDVSNYEVKTWDIVRSRAYGSDRFDKKALAISKAVLQRDGKSVILYMKDIERVDVMTISYDLKDTEGNELKGTVQNTVNELAASIN